MAALADPYLVSAIAEHPCTAAKLVTELEALNIAGVRTYSIVGAPGVCDGVYPWDASAPTGEYDHIQVGAADVQQIQQAIAAHVPDPPPPSLDDRIASALAAIENDSSLDASTRTALTDVVTALTQ